MLVIIFYPVQVVLSVVLIGVMSAEEILEDVVVIFEGQPFAVQGTDKIVVVFLVKVVPVEHLVMNVIKMAAVRIVLEEDKSEVKDIYLEFFC